MKNISVSILFLVLALVFSTSQAQKPESGNYHIHRGTLKKSFEKFKSEKVGRVVFLGGSITWNGGWRDSVCLFLQHEFPETKFDFINAGIPSMGSTPGAFRFSRDVLKNGKVDLLFEEAAVNDDTNETKPVEILRGMEGIVRHAKTANPGCDVVFLYFVDPEKMTDYRNGETPLVIQLHEKVAAHYQVSSVNLAKEVTERIDAGEFDWENDFKDLHPSPFGQNIYAQSIKIFLENAWKSDAEIDQNNQPGLPEALDKWSYENGILVEPNPPKPIKGWHFYKNWNPEDGVNTRSNYVDVPMLVGEFPGKIIRFPFTGNAVGIAVAAGPDAGTIEYSIDNSEWQMQDLYTRWSSGLYLPWYYTLASGLKNGKHILQLRLTESTNPKTKGNKCVLRYFYVNGN